MNFKFNRSTNHPVHFFISPYRSCTQFLLYISYWTIMLSVGVCVGAGYKSRPPLHPYTPSPNYHPPYHWTPPRVAFVSPVPSALSSVEVNVKIYGAINCMLAMHEDTARCNRSYHQALTNLIIRGYKKESEHYKRQFCCGLWSRQRCIAEYIRRKCERQTYLDLTKEKNPFAVDGQNGHHIINCDKYTERTCSGFPLFTHQWALLMILVSILTSLWCT